MKSIVRLLLTAVAVVILAHFLSGVWVENYGSAVIVAIVLAILRLFVQPILELLSLPITIVTLGLFLFVINGAIILLASNFIDGFAVANIWWAMLFSVLLSCLQSMLFAVLKQD